MIYRVGMRVRIDNELNENDSFGVAEDMLDYTGKIATVLLVGRNEHGKYVRLDIDREAHFWSYGMINPLVLNKGREEG